MRAVGFDLDGTLLHYTRDYRDLLADAMGDVIGSAPSDALDGYEEAFFDRFQPLEPNPVQRAFQEALPEAEADALADALLRREIEATEPPAGAAADLERLGERYRLGVLTNGLPEWQRAKLGAHGLADVFDTFVASYEAGAHKPAVEPFQLFEERLLAERYAMVGDDSADVDGAAAAGWAAYRYDGSGFGGLPEAIDWP
ncbi:MAG: HAD family hydrolase [Halobacteriales archaeon]